LSHPANHPDEADAVPAGLRAESLPFYLTVEEFAERARIGRTLAYSLARTGQIQSVKFGRAIRIPRSALEAK
jgi:excisionase family DNA binding protein